MKKDVLYFGLPENAIIRESKKRNLFLGDIHSLTSNLANLKKDLTLQTSIMITQQFNKQAALWAVEKFVKLVTAAEFKILPIDISLFENRETFKLIAGFNNLDGDNLLGETKKIILKFKEEILFPSSLTVTYYNRYVNEKYLLPAGYNYHNYSVLQFNSKK